MILPLVCDYCLQNGDPGNAKTRMAQHEDGEVCPYCHEGHLYAYMTADDLSDMRLRFARNLDSTWRAQLAYKLGELSAKQPEATEDNLQIMAALEASWQEEHQPEGATT